MDILELQQMSMKSFRRRTDILKAKGFDYSTTNDTLDNFKRVGKFVGMSPERYCLVLITLKVDRLINLLCRRKSTPKNESVRDTIDDLHNYIDLLEGLLTEVKSIEQI